MLLIQALNNHVNHMKFQRYLIFRSQIGSEIVRSSANLSQLAAALALAVISSVLSTPYSALHTESKVRFLGTSYFASHNRSFTQ